ncbi:bifunctional diguanylate cyclase/phosphodiesterase [Rhabdochromatium marinum]|uniref:sensor domain-containing protein n=1 Tax=Rhabdochromatium marinum TaxID=48729 RepID=UPI001907FCE0|nr:sensor domain-containing diguanylate cyclase [Rhabdochromatium marinum]MBK1649218.1 hypothetical protein [Rhabdochromatium marinum]
MKTLSIRPLPGCFGGLRPFLLPIVILAIGLTLTAGFWLFAREQARQHREDELSLLACKVAGLIDERLRDNVPLLHGMPALLARLSLTQDRLRPVQADLARPGLLAAFDGGQWSIAVTAAPTFEYTRHGHIATWGGLGGLTLSLLLALIFAIQTQAQRRLASAMGALERTNQQLAEQERQLIWAQRTAQLGSWTFDPSTKQASWSEAMFPIWGLNPEDGVPSYEEHRCHIHPDDWSTFDQLVSRAAERGEPYQLRLRIRRPDGEERRMITICTPHLNAQGQVVRLSGTVQDITEREQEEVERCHLQAMLARTERLAHVGSWELEVETGRVSWSEELFRIFQMDPAEGAPSFTEHHRLLYPEDFARLKKAMDAVINEGSPYALELRARCRDGSTRECFTRGYPEIRWSHKVTHVYGTFEDITERKEAERALRLAASVFAHSFEAIIITDAENRIVETNPAFSNITGYARASVLGKNPSILASGHHNEAFYRAMWDAIRHQGSWRGEVWNRRQDGQLYAELLSIAAVRDADNAIQNYIGVFSDISELKAHEGELDRLANYDALTELPNRRLLSDRLEQALAGTRRSDRLIAVCYLDLDNFKPINDEYGHEMGDEVLISIADRLRTLIRAQDTVARLGGDEFVLLFSDLVQAQDSHLLLERVLAVATAPILLHGVTHRVSASIGVVLSPPDVESADSLLRHADQAMYCAKQAGGNRYHFHDGE